MTLTLRVDPTCPTTRESWWGSEFHRAMRGLVRASVAQLLPVESILHLFTAEVTERARAGHARDEFGIPIPFWPRALLESEQVEPHAALEFEALLPPYRVVGYEAAPSDLCSAATALLGEVPIDVFRYRDHLRDLACRSGWEWIAEDLPPDAVTGSAVVWREGLVFLERRPVTAAVSPGVLDTFGGHVEAGEPVADAMARELREELGISPLSPRFFTAYERQEDPPCKRYHHGIWLVNSWRGGSDPTHPHGVWVRPEAALADPSLNPALVPVLRSLVPDPARGRVQGS